MGLQEVMSVGNGLVHHQATWRGFKSGKNLRDSQASVRFSYLTIVSGMTLQKHKPALL